MKKKMISQFSSCAAVGSTIYCIGGQKTQTSQYSGRLLDKADQSTKYYGRLLDKVRYLDTSIIPQTSWPNGPLMLNARSESCTVALKGKIYVMGGTMGEPWAEVFNPESDPWVALPSTSPKPSDSVLLHIAGDEFYWICCDSSSDNITMLCCLKFRVSEHTAHNDKGYLNAFLETCQSYFIRRRH